MRQSRLSSVPDHQIITEAKRRGWRVDVKITAPPRYVQGLYEQFVEKCLLYYGVEIKLDATEKKLMTILLEHSPTCVSTERICNILYGDRLDGGPLNAKICIRTYIANIRKQIKNTFYEIKTKWNEGYALIFNDLSNEDWEDEE